MQFAFLVNVLNMLAYLLLSGLKQLGHHAGDRLQDLLQPHRVKDIKMPLVDAVTLADRPPEHLFIEDS
jgi:glycosylphosphatidylinositol transamidase (GPIT) subunit GPI8